MEKGKIGSRYLEGMVIAQWDSLIGNKFFGPDRISTEEDHIINRLIVTADVKENEPAATTLVAYIETEVVSIEDGIDEGYIELPTRRVYTVLFPEGAHVRKKMLRQMRENRSIMIDLVMA